MKKERLHSKNGFTPYDKMDIKRQFLFILQNKLIRKLNHLRKLKFFIKSVFIKSNPFCSTGFNIIEALLAISVFVLIVTALVGALVYSRETGAAAGEKTRAILLADEGLEVARNIRDAGFANLIDGAHGLATSSNQWVFSGAEDLVDIFTRSIKIGKIDSRRKIATSTISWSQTPQRAGLLNIETYFTDWRRNFGNWALASQESSADVADITDATKIAIYKTAISTYAVITRLTSAQDELVIFDITNAPSIAKVGSLDLSADANDIAVSGHYAFIASSLNNQELQIIDISNPTAPILAGSFDAAGNLNGLSVAVIGDVVFLGRETGSSPELQAISVANPSLPIALSSIDLSDGVKSLTLAQNNQYLYAADYSNSEELIIISVSNPSNIYKIGSYNASGNSDGTAVSAFSNYAVLGRESGEISIVDVSNPSLPALVGSSFDIGANVNDLAMAVGDIYVVAATDTNAAAAQILSVENPSAPLVLKTINLSGDANGAIWDFDLNRAFIASTANSEEIISIRPN